MKIEDNLKYKPLYIYIYSSGVFDCIGEKK